MTQRNALARRFSALTFWSVSATMILASAVLITRDVGREESELEARGATVSSLIAGNSEFALYTGDPSTLHPLLQRLEAEEGVAYVQVLDANRRPLVTRRYQGTEELSSVERAPDASARASSRTTRDAAGNEVLEFLVPVTSVPDSATSALFDRQASHERRLLGYVRLGMVHEALAQRVQRAAPVVLTTLALLLAISLGVTRMLTRRVTRPLEMLVEATDAVAQGRLEHAPVAATGDEVEQLGIAFEAMVARLRDARDEVEEYQRSLEARVVARTRELEATTIEAVQLRERAEQASRVKSQFLANMSHEIRTPMNGVLGMLELVQGSGLPPKVQQFVETAHRSAEALLQILNDILDFSKIEAGKLELHPTDLDLRHEIEDVCEMLAPRAHDKGLDLIAQVPHDLLTSVNGDVTRLRQVLINLLGNAIKFTEQGSVTVSVALDDAGAQGNAYRFTVRDTGIGMSPEVQARLFQPFMQADGSTTRKYGGTGLGLAISSELVQLMGGSLQVSSAIGVGSAFSFVIALDRRVHPVLPDVGADALRGRRILIVDDNATNRDVLREQLSAWGVVSDEATDGASGLRKLRTTLGHAAYDAVILDFSMPDMDGGDVARAVRSDPLMRRLPLLLLSSARSASEPAPVDAVLVKPARMRELRERLAQLTSGSRERPASHTGPTAAIRRWDGRRILVVEDNEINQRVIVGMLEEIGFDVRLASDGAAALALLTTHEFDLVFMDQMMPIMDGRAATREYRRREGDFGRRTPIIALTAATVEEDRAACLEAGMDGFLAKPFRRIDLLTVLNEWFPAHATSPREATAETTAPEPAPVPESLLDESALESIRSFPGGDRILAEAVASLLESLPPQLRALVARVEAWEDGVRPHLKAEAHRMKSGVGMLGAVRLADALRAVERDADTSTPEQLRARVSHVCSAWKHVEPALRHLLREYAGAR